MTSLRQLADESANLAFEIAEVSRAALIDAGLDPGRHFIDDLPDDHPAWARLNALQSRKNEVRRLRGVTGGGVDCRTGARKTSQNKS
jgi:hypothetical protein